MVKVFSLILLTSCNSTNTMHISTFFQSIKDSENLDTSTEITVPDQSLSVRDILTRFTRGQMVIPDIDSGDDDDIDAELNDFEDYVDAVDSIARSKRAMHEENLKNADNSKNVEEKVERSETIDETEHSVVE